MVNIHMENKHAEIGFEGDPLNVAMEVAIAIGGIYRGLTNINELDGFAFKEFIKRFVQDQSPTWDQEQDMTMIVIPKEK